MFKLLQLFSKIWDRFLMIIAIHQFKAIGKGCVFHTCNSDFTTTTFHLVMKCWLEHEPVLCAY